MKQQLTQAKNKLLSTQYPRWRNRLSSLVLGLICSGIVVSWWYMYFTTANTQCHKGILYFSVLWLAVQWVVIAYLYSYQNLPAFAREAIKLLILLGNVWFGFFILSLQACT